ncbi:penicillin-binding transpeptidase domain-containing protein [Clostridium hydrogenum]|uniref:penicillin-binding transpeptidase domain-containing protein n=1 Tax=Clostridium hydrogenum TaxID=2855764 RepID=UPI001F2AAA61|nr:penicillin-binding transpeptidase domain-containing protein [Clostridium hydrogenum]
MKKRKQKRFTRFTALIVVIFIVFSAIFARLVVLQVVEAQSYTADANTKATKFIKEDAPRGQILDSTGTVLATSKQSFNVTYVETDTTQKVFYTTIAKVFSILDANGESQDDDFPLKVSPTYTFDFQTNDPDTIKKEKLRFLTDRGFRDNIRKNLYGSKKETDLTDAQKKKEDDYELKITAKYAFEKLAGKKGYNIPTSYTYTMDGKTVSKKCSAEDIRRFMVVKDAVKMQSYSGYNSVSIASDIKRDTAFAFLQKINELPGIDISTEPIREYPYGKLASNVIGYIGKITPSNTAESESYLERGYDVNTDLKGIAGIESAEEDRLRGSAGGKIVQVNKNGRVVNEVASRDAYPGQNIQLTINKDVQYAAEQQLLSVMKNLRENPNGAHDSYTGNATRGAAVAIDVNTGGVLALVSEPNFDPNDFADPNGLSTAALKKYFPDVATQASDMGISGSMMDTLFPVDKSTGKRTDQYDYLAKPLYDYATMSLIPPGSTFKPLTAIAGLETKVITPYTAIYDPGSFSDGKGFKAQFNADGYLGTNDLVNAIAKSSNGYFMTVGEKLREAFGEDIIAKYAWKFGLGVQPNSGVSPSTGLEIQENFGQVFNSYSIRNNFGQQAAWAVMADLQNKKYLSKDPAINLYTQDSDAKDVQSLKVNIKDEIKNAVVSAAAQRSKLITNDDKVKIKDLITKLIETDVLYKGKSFSDSDISKIVAGISNEVNYYSYQATIPANTYNASIGQGTNQFTPVQLANYVATIANGGKRYKVHLVDSITDADGKVIKKYEPESQDTGVSQSTLSTIKQGMEMVNTIGTAAGQFSNLPFQTAGKTGTADPYSQDKEKEIGRTSYSVYVGFAPADNPKIAIATVVFDGGFGGTSTSIAKAMYEAYFGNVLKMPNIPNDFNFTTQKEVDGN